MKCEECDAPALVSVRKDPFGKSDEFLSYCLMHAPAAGNSLASFPIESYVAPGSLRWKRPGEMR